MIMRVIVAIGLLFAIAANVALAQDKVDFQTQIQPIFVEHCINCHGEKQASGKMRLHTAANLKEKWDADKELLVAGEPEKSELYQRLKEKGYRNDAAENYLKYSQDIPSMLVGFSGLLECERRDVFRSWYGEDLDGTDYPRWLRNILAADSLYNAGEIDSTLEYILQNP